ncbi:MAG: Flp pilus assembly protein CpaB [Myxococcota bacterium]
MVDHSHHPHIAHVPRRGQLAIDEESARGCRMLAILSVMNFVLGAATCSAVLVLLFARAELARVLADKEDRLTTIAVPAREIEPGEVIDAAALTTRPFPKVLVPEVAVTSAADLVGRTARERLLPGESVRYERLADPRAGRGVNAIIGNNLRAVSLELRDDDRVGGFVVPGDRVDLLVTLPDHKGTPAETVTVARALQVIAVDERVVPRADGDVVRKPSVTLAVPMADAERVVHAAHEGEPKLTLLSDVDLGRPPASGVTAAQVLGAPGSWMSASEFRAHYGEADVARWVELIRGDKVERQRVDVDPELLRAVPGVGPGPTVPAK